jgi:hypothetical protein
MKKIIKSICIEPKYWDILVSLAKDNKRSASNMVEYLIKQCAEKKGE